MADQRDDDNRTELAGSRDRKFRRSREERMLAGVCGGASSLFGVDAALIRVFLVAATVLGFGSGLLVYAACWLIVPEE